MALWLIEETESSATATDRGRQWKRPSLARRGAFGGEGLSAKLTGGTRGNPMDRRIESCIQRPVTGKFRMAIPDDWKETIRRNKLLGMWAAEKLGIAGREAESYSDALAVGTLDPERSDVLSKIRQDFDAAGVVQSDEQILRVMNEFTLEAGNQEPITRGGAPDALAVMLARQLKPP